MDRPPEEATITDRLNEVQETVSRPRVPHRADSEATTVAELRADFNDMLQKLRDAGLMQPPENAP